jgi:hypothetical protein
MDAHDWNIRLVDAVFSAKSGSSSVRIIEATDRFLASLLDTGIPTELAARKDFLRALVEANPNIRTLFDFDLKMAEWRRTLGPPTFFGELYFSLLVASANQETQDEGDFRRRLCKVLDIPQGNYVSNGLPRLWEQVKSWSQAESESGGRFRPLMLPDPGHESIIGYPKRLAFPGFKDLGRLARIMFDNKLSHESPYDTVLGFLGPVVRDFSTRFQDEYLHLRRVLQSNPDAAFLTPMWAAIEAATFEPFDRPKKSGTRFARFALELFFDDYDQPDIHIFSNVAIERSSKTPLTALRATLPVAGCVFRLQPDAPHRSLQTLLSPSGFLQRILKSAAITTQLEQGCLAFAPDQEAPWIWRAALPRGGPVQFICQKHPSLLVVRLLESHGQTFSGPTQIAGAKEWFLLSTEDSHLIAEHQSGLDGFQDYDALRPGLLPPRIILRGALRTSDGILLTRASRPTVLAIECDSVSLTMALIDGTSSALGNLEYMSEHHCFRPTPEQLANLKLPAFITFIGRKMGEVTASLRIMADETAPETPLIMEFDESAYLEETGNGQLTSADSRGDTAEYSASNPHAAAAVARIHPVDHYLVKATVREYPNVSAMPAVDWDDLGDTLYAAFLNAQSLDERRVLDLVANACDSPIAFHPTTSLTFLWHSLKIRKLWHRRWRGARYFPLTPYLQFNGTTGVLRLLGLAPRQMRRRFLDELADFDPDELVGGLGLLRAPSASGLEQDTATALALRLRMPLYASARHILPSPSKIVTMISPRYRANLTPGRLTHWSENIGTFVDTPMIGSELSMRRIEYERAQAMFEISHRDELLWATESRAWAILMYRLLLGTAGYYFEGSRVIATQPLPFSFALAAVQSGGYIESSNPGYRTSWVYRFGTSRELREFIGHVVERAQTPLVSIMRWASSANKRRGGPPGLQIALARRYSWRNE